MKFLRFCIRPSMRWRQ